MATYNATDFAKNEVTLPMKMSDAHSKGGRMRVLHDSYTQSGTGAVSSVIRFGRIPGGARVWEATMSSSATLHASGKLNLAVGADEILAEVTFGSGTRCRVLEQGSASAAAAAPITCTLGGIVTCTGDSAMAQIADTTLTVTIKYTID